MLARHQSGTVVRLRTALRFRNAHDIKKVDPMNGLLHWLHIGHRLNEWQCIVHRIFAMPWAS